MFLSIQEDPAQKVRIQHIADAFEIPKNHLIKVVHRLGQEGYVETVRGKGGGIKLCQPPEKVSVGEVVRSMEATLHPVSCDKPACCIQSGCLLKPVLFQAMRAFLSVLDQYSLADISANPEALKRLLQA